MASINWISLGPKVREHVVPATGSALVTKCGDVYRCDHDSLAWTGRGLREQPAIVVDNLASTRPRVRWVHFQARALVRAYYVSYVLDCPATIHYRPPVHRLGRAPRIHVS